MNLGGSSDAECTPPSFILDVDASAIDAAWFRSNCLEPNRPCIVRNCRHLVERGSTVKIGTSTTDTTTTPAAAATSSPQSHQPLAQLLSPSSLLQTFGPDFKVPFQYWHCDEKLEQTEDDRREEKEQREKVEEDDDAMVMVTLGDFFGDPSTNQRTKALIQRGAYVKDWHFVLDRAEKTATKADGGAECNNESSSSSHCSLHLPYTVPSFLGGEDFLNEVCDVTREAKKKQKHDATQQDDEPAVSVDPFAPIPPPSWFGTGESDYRFVYFGRCSSSSSTSAAAEETKAAAPPLHTRGTWTPLHFDVCGSYSWSYNVAGKKVWYFGEELVSESDDQSQAGEGKEQKTSSISSSFSLGPWPVSQGSSGRPLDCRVCASDKMHFSHVVQYPGDLVFVPAMMYHQVHNVGAVSSSSSSSSSSTASDATTNGVDNDPLDGYTVSINHNWMTRHNLLRCTHLLRAEINALESMVDDEVLRNFKKDDEDVPTYTWCNVHDVVGKPAGEEEDEDDSHGSAAAALQPWIPDLFLHNDITTATAAANSNNNNDGFARCDSLQKHHQLTANHWSRGLRERMVHGAGNWNVGAMLRLLHIAACCCDDDATQKEKVIAECRKVLLELCSAA